MPVPLIGVPKVDKFDTNRKDNFSTAFDKFAPLFLTDFFFKMPSELSSGQLGHLGCVPSAALYSKEN